MKKLTLLLLLTIISFAINGQEPSKAANLEQLYMLKADDYFNRYEFRKAIIYYNKAYRKDTSNYMALLKKAEAYGKLNLFVQAELSYRQVFESGYSPAGKYMLMFALTLLANEKFDESKFWLNLYNQQVDDDFRAKAYLQSIENRDEFYKDSTVQFVENVWGLNSEQSEINPWRIGNHLVFASTRINAIDQIRNDYYDLYNAELDSSGKITKVNGYNSSLKSNFHEGPIAVDPSNTKLFITRNLSKVQGKKDIQLGIFQSKLPATSEESLNLQQVIIKNVDYSIGHPSVNSNSDVIYFIAKEGNGQGGLDIYKSEKSVGGWSSPINLGEKINTKGDEMFPFILNDTLLYFSSDGHGGLGRLDLFKVNLSKEPLEVVNLGYPINSVYDDFSIFVNSSGDAGYFCSNRSGGRGNDDIYRFEYLNFRIKEDAGKATKTGNPLINITMGDGKEFKLQKSKEGKFAFSFLPATKYRVIIENVDYRAEEILQNDTSYSEAEKSKLLNELKPLQRTEMVLEPGVKYDFSTGPDSIQATYYKRLDSLKKRFNNQNESLPYLPVQARQLELIPGNIYSMQILKEEDEESPIGTSYFFSDRDTLALTSDSALVLLPALNEKYFSLKSDLAHIENTFNPDSVRLSINQTPIFSNENPNLGQEVKEYTAKGLFRMSINTPISELDQSLAKRLTAPGFSVIPQSNYKLLVSKLNMSGQTSKEIEIPLTNGVKYNFNSTDTLFRENRSELYKLAKDSSLRVRDRESKIDINLLSKELELKAGEEVVFNLIPDTLNNSSQKPSNSKLIINNEIVDFNRSEDILINIPYFENRLMKIETDMDYIEKNFNLDEVSFSYDTIPFFSEITVDTSGYTDRILRTEEELSLLGQIKTSINKNLDTLDPGQVKHLTATQFSVVTNSDYKLLIGKRTEGEEDPIQVEVALNQGVRYNFNPDGSDFLENRSELLNLLKSKAEAGDIGNGVPDIQLLSKVLDINNGDEITLSLIPNPKEEAGVELEKSQLFINDGIVNFDTHEHIVINIPITEINSFKLESDAEFVKSGYALDELSLSCDTLPFFHEPVGNQNESQENEFTVATVDNGLTGKEEPEPLNIPESQAMLDLPTNMGAQENLDGVKYRVQIAAARKPISLGLLKKRYSGEREIRMFEEDGWYKYYIADAPSYFEAKQVLNASNVKGAFIVAYKDGGKFTLRDAMAGQYKKRMESDGMPVNDSIVNMVTVNFEFDKFSLREDDRQYLQQLVIEKMQELERAYVAINGHTDIQGSNVYNYGLANERANYVKQLLVANGISAERIKTFSFGESQLLKSCVTPIDCDDSVHKVNRRVEIVVLMQKGL